MTATADTIPIERPEPPEGPRETERPLPWLMAETEELPLRFELARRAQSEWCQTPPKERARVLAALADTLLSRKSELVDLIVEENGKPPVEAMAHEIGPSVANVRWLCDHAVSALEPERVAMPWMPHRKAEIRHEPIELALIISPWNFPLSIPLGQVVAGLLAGSAVILKPSEVTPRAGEAIRSLLDDCALPPNLFQVVQGDGRIGERLIDLRPDKVFFTGSLATGRRVMAAAAKHPIPVALELGGVDALIVLEDADLDLASSAAVWGGLMNAGQVCASVERVLVHRSVKDVFLARVLEKVQAVDPVTELGRYTADKQRAVYERHLEDAKKRGLELLSGGHWLGERKLAPTIITGEDEQVAGSLVYREESFGPLVSVRTFRDDAEAVRRHDELWGGLTVSIFSSDEDRAARLAGKLDAGLASINDVAATLHAVPELPWGGVKASGFGRSHGVEGLLEFTVTKVVDRPRGKTGFKRPWWFPYDADQGSLLDAYVRLIGERRLSRKLRASADLVRSALRSMLRAPRR